MLRRQDVEAAIKEVASGRFAAIDLRDLLTPFERTQGTAKDKTVLYPDLLAKLLDEEIGYLKEVLRRVPWVVEKQADLEKALGPGRVTVARCCVA